MTDNNFTKRRRFQKRYIPLVLLVAFVCWGIWPMLAPHWDQDQCSFGEVTNERYGQMREEVREDVKKALQDLRATFSKTEEELKTLYPADLTLLKRWGSSDSKNILKFYPQYNEIKRAILTRLVLKYTKNQKTGYEKLAYTHAIMREMGGWFHKISKFQDKRQFNDQKTLVEVSNYKYVFSSFIFNDDFLSKFEQLIFRYNFISSTFYRHLGNRSPEYNDTGWRRTNLIDGFYYMTAFPSGGCPTIISRIQEKI